MKLRASEFISKAEGLKSSELSIQQKLEGIRSRRSSIQSEISTLEFRLDSLYMQLEALESSDSDDEDGADNSGAIAAVMAEISSTHDEISDCRQQNAELRSQEMEADADLRQIEMEEQETLSDIQDSAARTNQNIALISSFGGDYANVSAQASGSFQHNLGQLSQAAQILGGSVAMGVAGVDGRSAGRVSRGNAGQADGSGRNFYEAANNQRKSENSTAGAMGAKAAGGVASVRKAPDLYSETTLEEERPDKKSGGFGKKVSNLKKNIVNAFNLGGAVKEFSGCTAVKRSDQQDCWDIPGTGFEAYDDFRNNHGNYERVTYDTPHMETVSADNIEGISNIRTADVEHPEIFWGRDSGKTMQDFMNIAQHIPEVEQQLKCGKNLDELMMDDRLGKCASIYFANAPTVYKGDGFYEFSGNGRHRILAARALGLAIPVVVAGEIRNKKQSGLGKRDAFIERIKYTPTPTDAKKTSAAKTGTTDDSKGQRERDIADEYYRDNIIVGSKSASGFGQKKGKTGHFSEKYKLALRSRISNADTTTKKAFEKLSSKLKIQDDQYYDIPHYWEADSSEKPRGVYMNSEVDEENIRGEGSTYFHELGHMMDHASSNFKRHASDNIRFKEALKKDGEYMSLLYDRMNDEQKATLKQLLRSDTLHSVEDLLEGLTQGKIRGKWGHGLKYWNDRPAGIQREAFAHFFEARMGGGRKLKYLKKFFPNASSVFDDIMADIAEGGEV